MFEINAKEIVKFNWILIDLINHKWDLRETIKQG